MHPISSNWDANSEKSIFEQVQFETVKVLSTICTFFNLAAQSHFSFQATSWQPQKMFQFQEVHRGMIHFVAFWAVPFPSWLHTNLRAPNLIDPISPIYRMCYPIPFHPKTNLPSNALFLVLRWISHRVRLRGPVDAYKMRKARNRDQCDSGQLWTIFGRHL